MDTKHYMVKGTGLIFTDVDKAIHVGNQRNKPVREVRVVGNAEYEALVAE